MAAYGQPPSTDDALWQELYEQRAPGADVDADGKAARDGLLHDFCLHVAATPVFAALDARVMVAEGRFAVDAPWEHLTSGSHAPFETAGCPRANRHPLEVLDCLAYAIHKRLLAKVDECSSAAADPMRVLERLKARRLRVRVQARGSVLPARRPLPRRAAHPPRRALAEHVASHAARLPARGQDRQARRCRRIGDTRIAVAPVHHGDAFQLSALPRYRRRPHLRLAAAGWQVRAAIRLPGLRMPRQGTPRRHRGGASMWHLGGALTARTRQVLVPDRKHADARDWQKIRLQETPGDDLSDFYGRVPRTVEVSNTTPAVDSQVGEPARRTPARCRWR